MADYKSVNIRNKRATFDYEILEEYIAGIVLVGTEIKSIRLGKASLTDCYCYFEKGELWIRGVKIAAYGCVGLRLFLSQNGFAKVVVGLARGRKAYDKREYLKENDAKREMDKAMKRYK